MANLVKQESKFIKGIKDFVIDTENKMDINNEGLIVIAFDKNGILRSTVTGNHNKLICCLTHLLNASDENNKFRKLVLETLNLKEA